MSTSFWSVSITKLMSLYSYYDVWLPPAWAGNYWTSYLQHGALKHGAYVGRKIGRGEDSSDFESRASLILDYLQERYRLSIFRLSELRHLNSVDDLERRGRMGD